MPVRSLDDTVILLIALGFEDGQFFTGLNVGLVGLHAFTEEALDLRLLLRDLFIHTQYHLRQLPVLPYPPSPRSVSGNSSTSTGWQCR